MAAIDYDAIPEPVRQSLLAATYNMARQMFQDPQVQAEYREWLAKRNAAQQAAK